MIFMDLIVRLTVLLLIPLFFSCSVELIGENESQPQSQSSPSRPLEQDSSESRLPNSVGGARTDGFTGVRTSEVGPEGHQTETTQQLEVEPQPEAVRPLVWAIVATDQPNQYLLDLDSRLQVERVQITQQVGESNIPRVFNGTKPIVLEGGFSYKAEFGGLEHQIDFRVPKDIVLQGAISPQSPSPGRFDASSGRLEISTDGRVFIAQSAQVSVGQHSLLLRGKELLSQGGYIRSFSSDAQAAGGHPGASGGLIDLQFETAKGELHIELYGQAGGQGPTGPAHGGPAASGPDRHTVGVDDSRCGVHPGTNGSNGAQGNAGGLGMQGGSGGRLILNVEDLQGMKVLIRGGAGRGGAGGEGGPGQPGGGGGLGPTTYYSECDIERNPMLRIRFDGLAGQFAGEYARLRESGIRLARACVRVRCPNTPVRGGSGATGPQGPRGPTGPAGALPGELCYLGENQCQALPSQYQQGQWTEFRWP